MEITIKQIGEGVPYHIRFKKTQVYKRVFGQEEQLIDEYIHEDGDEDFSEVYWLVQAGFATWFNFNKIERLERLGVIDYHKTIFMGDFDFNGDDDIEYVTSHAADGQPVSLTIQKNRHGHMADILITYPDWYYRVHLEAPFFFNNMRNV